MVGMSLIQNIINAILRPSRLRNAELVAEGDVKKGQPAYWCPVANVVLERPSGENVDETLSGTKHFKPGAKVYAIDAHWGMGGERVIVVGHHRGSKGYITITMATKYLTNWRAELTYSPHIIEELKKHELGKYEPNSLDGKFKAEQMASALSGYGPQSQPFTTRQKR